jgi:hypothetical protein
MESKSTESTIETSPHRPRKNVRPSLTLFADRSGQRWIVLDGEGNLWELPAGDDPWERRQPFYPSEEMDLDLVPGHYKQLLGLPP